MACRQSDASEGSPCNEDGRSTDANSDSLRAQVALLDEQEETSLEARSPNVQYLEDELRVILIGKTGVGKSATGNMIIGKNHFKSEFGGAPVTKECNEIHTHIFGRDILVVDTPGIFDAETDPNILQEEIKKCIKIAAPGPHAILFVMKLTDRYGREDYEAATTFCSYFGEKMLDHVITVFTHADIIQHENITLEAYVDKSPPQLKELLQYFGNRQIAFNNKCDPMQRESQVECLLTMIEALKTKRAAYYVDKNFEIAEKGKQQREKQIEDSLKKEYSEKTEEFRRPEFDVREHETTKPSPAMEVKESKLTLKCQSYGVERTKERDKML